MTKTLLTTLFCIICFSTVNAQNKDDKAITEIKSLRTKLVEAIKQRDKKLLEEFYANDFTHTHASGQVDEKPKRINALISGDLTIESAEVKEINIRIYNKSTAVAIGQSSITDATKKTTNYRRTIVYVKTKKRWQIVSSQATKIQ